MGNSQYLGPSVSVSQMIVKSAGLNVAFDLRRYAISRRQRLLQYHTKIRRFQNSSDGVRIIFQVGVRQRCILVIGIANYQDDAAFGSIRIAVVSTAISKS